MLTELYPTFKKNNIAVVFSITDNYVPIFGTCLQSLINNSSPRNNYDIYVFSENISENNQMRLKLMCSQKNFSLRFIDIKPYLSKYPRSDFYLSEHITIAAYYRFFIPSVFKNFDKIIYSDSDVIYENDVALLYKQTIGECIIGAALSGWQYAMNDKFKHYALDILKMTDASKYIQDGILLCNIKRMIAYDFTNKCIKALKRIKTPKTWDQCIINSVCNGQIYFLDQKWNVEWHYPFCHPNYEQKVSQRIYDDYLEARAKPNIVHYASAIKPWNAPERDLASNFWKYARVSPFYEEILEILLASKMPKDPDLKQIKEIANLGKLKINYLRYKLLSFLTIGKKRRKYCEKKKSTKTRIKNIKKFLRTL